LARFFPQTQQGADIIAKTLNATVYMPDFFEPHAAFPNENFPPKTEEAKAELQSFFKGPANTSAAIAKLLSFGRTLRDGGAKKVCAYGFCWGWSYFLAIR
jgi:dienelactone hydrolase